MPIGLRIAVWTPASWSVTFDANGGKGGTTRHVESGAAVGEFPVVSRDGYTLTGWFTAAEGGSQVSASALIEADTTYFAQWEENGVSLTIVDGVLTRVGVVGFTEVTIPGEVRAIESGAFADCGIVQRVILPSWFEGTLDSSAFAGCADGVEIVYYDPPYTIDFHRNDASSEKTEAYDFDYGVATRLPTLNSMGWARRGFDFLGWATSAANAAKGTIWKADAAVVSTAAAPGAVLDAYAAWALKDGYYAIYFVRNDGAGTWRTVGFQHGTKTRMPSLASGLGWGRRGYQFNGWALSAADANNGVIWKGDWANIAEPTAAGNTLAVYASWSLKPGFYQVRFNKNDGTGKWRTLGFECGASAKLNTIAGLGWEIPGKTFRGWASNKANADTGKVWKLDGAWLKDATAEGKTLSIYAIWE